MAEIKKCSCESPFQDRTYGKGMRVMNKCGKGVKDIKYRCTICKNVTN